MVFRGRHRRLRPHLGFVRSLRHPHVPAARRHEPADRLPRAPRHRRRRHDGHRLHHHRRRFLARRTRQVSGHVRGHLWNVLHLWAHSRRLAHRLRFLARHLLCQPAGGHRGDLRHGSLFSLLASRRSSAAHRLGGSLLAYRLHRPAAAGAHLGDRLRLGFLARGPASRHGGGDARRVPVFGNQSHRAADPAHALPRSGNRLELRRGLHFGHGNVRRHHLPAAVHARRSGRVRHAIRQPAYAPAAGLGGRKHHHRTNQHAPAHLQTIGRHGVDTDRRGHDPFRAHGRGVHPP